MKKGILFVVFVWMAFSLLAISTTAAEKAVHQFLNQKEQSRTIRQMDFIGDETRPAAVVFSLEPTGFVLCSLDENIRPILAYSFENGFALQPQYGFSMVDFVQRDIEAHKAYVTESEKQINRARWQQALHSLPTSSNREDFEQWPPQGSTSTGGWLETNWHQNGPYNMFCPIDASNNARSITGCPSTAMAQIVNFHQELNGTLLTDADDYSYYADGSTFIVDDGAETYDFLTFPEINTYLETIAAKYENDEPLTNEEKAALTFACGIALQQMYGSSVSGTYFHPQIVKGFRRFGFSSAMMLSETSPALWERMASNMQNGLPAQLCVLQAGGAGHQVVVDGYNTDDEFHFNFGWGGSANGWYSFPLSGMPSQLNLFGTIVLDIALPETEFPQFAIDWSHEDGIYTRPETVEFDVTPVSGNSAEYYKLYLNGTFLDSLSSITGYTIDSASLPLGYHQIAILACDGNTKKRYQEACFEVRSTNIVFEENFEDTTWGEWSASSHWQLQENQLFSFANFVPRNSISATCPVAFGNYYDRLVSPIIALPDSNIIEGFCYVGFCDEYPTYPSMRIALSNDNGASWETLWQAATTDKDFSWDKIHLDLSDYAGEEIQLSFLCSGFSYYDISVDAIRIFTNSMTDAESVMPYRQKVAFMKNYPNPFNPETTIHFALPQAGNVELTIYNCKGQKVTTLISENRQAGQHSVIWNGCNQNGEDVASGVYFSRLTVNGQTQSIKKMALLK